MTVAAAVAHFTLPSPRTYMAKTCCGLQTAQIQAVRTISAVLRGLRHLRLWQHCSIAYSTVASLFDALSTTAVLRRSHMLHTLRHVCDNLVTWYY